MNSNVWSAGNYKQSLRPAWNGGGVYMPVPEGKTIVILNYPFNIAGAVKSLHSSYGTNYVVPTGGLHVMGLVFDTTGGAGIRIYSHDTADSAGGTQKYDFETFNASTSQITHPIDPDFVVITAGDYVNMIVDQTVEHLVLIGYVD